MRARAIAATGLMLAGVSLTLSIIGCTDFKQAQARFQRELSLSESIFKGDTSRHGSITEKSAIPYLVKLLKERGIKIEYKGEAPLPLLGQTIGFTQDGPDTSFVRRSLDYLNPEQIWGAELFVAVEVSSTKIQTIPKKIILDVAMKDGTRFRFRGPYADFPGKQL